MNQYWLVLVSIGALWLLVSQIRSYHIESIEGVQKYRWNWTVPIAAAFILAWIAIERPKYFGDTGNYFVTYSHLPTSLSGIVQYLQEYPKDFGFTIIMWIVKLTGLDTRGFFFALCFFQLSVVFLVYRKYSCNLFFSIFLFLLSTDYFSWTWNGVRQFTAVAICFAASPYIFNRQYIKAVFFFILAGMFHRSALYMFPIIFFVQGKVFNLKTMLILGAITLTLTFVSGFEHLLDGFLQDTQYANVITDYQTGVIGIDNGTNPIRVLVYSIPAILAFVGKKRIDQLDSNSLMVSANMSVLSAGIYLISMVTSGIFIGRLPIYCSLYNYILLPWELKNLFNDESAPIMKFLCYVFYFLFFMYQLWLWGAI